MVQNYLYIYILAQKDMKINKKISITLYTLTQILMSFGILFYLELDETYNYCLILMGSLSVLTYVLTASFNVKLFIV